MSRWLLLALVSCSAAWARPATAQPATAQPAPAQPATDRTAPAPTLWLAVTPGVGMPDAATLQHAIETELGFAVQPGERPGEPKLSVRAAGPAEAVVAFTDAAGRMRGRTVTLPTEPERAAETVALLAASLLRDEAADLLAALRRRPVPLPSPPVVAPAPAPATAAAPAEPEYRRIPWAIDVVPGIGFPPGWRTVREASLGILGTGSSAVDGVEAASVVAFKSAWLRGIQVAGVAALVLGDVSGWQVAGALTAAGGDVRLGGQLGVVNVAGGRLAGIQAGVVNLVGKDVLGAQLGVVNAALGNATVQVGVVNTSLGRTRLQIGIVNVAEDADVGLGLLSIYWRGRTQVEAWTQESGLSLVGVRHGSKYLHQVVGLGIHPGPSQPTPTLAYGVGARVPLGSSVYVDADAVHHFLGTGDDQFTQVRLAAGIRLMKRLAVWVGPTLNAALEPVDPDAWALKDGVSHVWDADVQPRFWFGAAAGVAVF